LFIACNIEKELFYTILSQTAPGVWES